MKLDVCPVLECPFSVHAHVGVSAHSLHTQAAASTTPSTESGETLLDSSGRISLTYSHAASGSNGSHTLSAVNGAVTNGNGNGTSHVSPDVALLQLTDVEVVTPRGGISTLLIQGLTFQVGGYARLWNIECFQAGSKWLGFHQQETFAVIYPVGGHVSLNTVHLKCHCTSCGVSHYHESWFYALSMASKFPLLFASITLASLTRNSQG